ncbi:conjugal transfer protein TraQ, partial [Salmonella enterica]|uniref:conjugal transfer protein TraQ n=1 Tax=Salmonella enterica TaxID=28901 RepID=UPI00215A0369
MNMDALTAIENLARSISRAGMDFLFTWGELIGVISMITLFARARSAGPVKMSPGKFIAGMLTSCMLVSLPAMINAAGVQMGFRVDSFGPIAYVKRQTFCAVAVSFTHTRTPNQSTRLASPSLPTHKTTHTALQP